MKKYNDQPENQSLPIRRIERQTIVEHVMENVRELIVSKRFKVGDKIPPETELARLFGIGRPTVREAIKVFQYLGIMESRPGTGTFICDRQHISAEALTWSILLGEGELYEVIQMREVLEGIGLRNLASKNSEDPSSISQVTESLEREVENIRAALAQDDTEEIMRADYSLRAVEIQQPCRTVRFVYLPDAFRIGLFISLLAAALIAAIAAAWLRGRARRSGGA